MSLSITLDSLLSLCFLSFISDDIGDIGRKEGMGGNVGIESPASFKRNNGYF
jgi:hypothetical protein